MRVEGNFPSSFLSWRPVHSLQAVRALSTSFRSEIQSIQAVNPIAGPPVACVSMLLAIPISAESSRLVRSAHLLESLSAACLWWPLHGVPSHSKGKRWVLTKTRAQEMTLSMLLLVLYKEMKRLITSLSNKGNWNIEQSGAAYRSIDILTYIKGGEGVLLGDWGRGFRFLHTICSPLSP